MGNLFISIVLLVLSSFNLLLLFTSFSVLFISNKLLLLFVSFFDFILFRNSKTSWEFFFFFVTLLFDIFKSYIFVNSFLEENDIFFLVVKFFIKNIYFLL